MTHKLTATTDLSSYMAKPPHVPSMAEEKVLAATGMGWDDWFTQLDDDGARDMDHRTLAQHIHTKFGTRGWWCQTITVEYERRIGRRKVGQSSSGTFQTAVSRTMAGDLDDVLETWLTQYADLSEMDGTPLKEPALVTGSDAWRYWRAPLEDGSRIVVTIGVKTPDKCILTVSMERLADEGQAERWKAYWKPRVVALN